jgi:hypothetical protein
MTVHLLKLSVGVENIEHLSALQSRRRQEAKHSGAGDRIWHQTRHMPRRAAELLDGGSIYWVIKGLIRARQRVRELEAVTGVDGIRRCRIILDPHLVTTEPRPRRPFQGWRYLNDADIPPDRDAQAADGGMPPEMEAELRSLGLI